MKSNPFKFALIVITVGILTACGSPATEAPASAPTEASVPTISSSTGAQAPSNSPATPATGSSEAGTVSFANDIAPLLQSRCGSCHGGDETKAGLNLLSYNSLMSGSENGPVVSAGDAANSLLVDLVASQKMPKRGPKLTPNQVQLITDWVNQGALNN